MKKIILGIFIICIISTLNANANELLVTLPNTLDEKYICGEDFIHNSNVMWDQIGEGKVDYFDKTTLNYLSKDVVITDIDSLKSGINITKNKNIEVDINIVVQKIVYVSESEFFILGKIDTLNYPYDSLEEKMFGYVGYYKNNTLQWQQILKKDRYGAIVDGVLVDRGIAILGEYDSISGKRNVFVNIISFNNVIVYEKEIQGSLNEYARSIYNIDETLIITGITESKNGDFFSFSKAGFDIFIGKIHLLSNEKEIHIIGNSGNDNLISSALHNNYLYLYVNFRGDGIFYNNTGESQDFKGIVEVDDRFGINNWISLEEYNEEVNESINVINEKIVLSNFTFGEAKLNFSLFDLKLNFESTKNLVIKDAYRLKEYKVYVDNNKLYISTLSTSNNYKEMNTFHILSDRLIEESYHTVYQNDEKLYIIDLLVIEGILRINLINDSNILILQDFLNIVMKDKLIETSSYYVNDYDIYMNGKIVPKVKLTSNVPASPFGSYYDLYSSKLSDIELVIKVEKYFYSNLNLRNKETYDVDTILKFNGIGYLNNEVINSNYKLSTPGKYVLELVGSNDKREIINFTVTNLSFEATSIEDFTNNEISPKYSNDYIYKKVSVNVSDNLEEKVDNKAIMIIFSTSCVGVILGIVLPINFWRRKDA